ncbi:MAG: carbamoyl-phosphate synthase [Myxococcaceae bacterium]
MPGYGGTLAAVRALGASGVRVTVAGSEWLAPARWSRSTARTLRSPPPRQERAFVDWLLAFGSAAPGHFLYPTSDDLAWLLARHASALKTSFCLFQPPLQTLVTLLDKKRLHGACAEVGLRTLPTWFPDSTEDVARLAPSLPRPLLIKPRTQVFLRTQNHGRLVEAGDDLASLHRRWLEHDRYLPGVEEDFGLLRFPMLQEFRRTEDGGVYSISGFVDQEGTALGARASRKLLQRPLRVGIGLCFEDAPVHPALLQGLVSLCRRTGYFGVFEAEFVRSGGEYHLIDFNPRFYGQMHFECARGLPLPVFAYLAAQGDRAGLQALAERASRFDTRGYRYAFRFGHHLLFAARRLAGTSTAEESARWSRWISEDPTRFVDASADPDDWAPGLVHAVAELWAAVRHGRGYLRGSVFDRP